MALEQITKNGEEGAVAPGLHREVIEVDATGKTLVAADSDALVVMTAAAATAIVLPAPVAGMQFEFTSSITATGDHTITTDAATTFIGGSIITAIDDTASKSFKGDGTSNTVVTLNGTTTGGEIGGLIRFRAISSTVWMVDGSVNASGVIITPFG